MYELFTPDTTIFFAYTGIDDSNKTVHNSVPEFVSFAKAHMKGKEMTGCSFQRLFQGYEIRVAKSDIQYEMLMYADTVIIYNGPTGAFQQWVGLIDSVEWKNPGCYFVYFHIDWYTSMLGSVDYEETYAYIEREHVVKDWNGTNPEFSNMGVDEGFATNPDTPVNCETVDFHFDAQKLLIYSPYNEDGKPNFTGTMEKGMYSAMFQHVMSPAEANAYLQKIADSQTADLNNIVSICSLPDEFENGKTEKKTFPCPWNKHVSNVLDFRNSKCWSGEFCQIVIMSGTGEKMTINPQWFGSNATDFDTELNYFYNNGEGGCTLTAVNKNQSYNFKAYNDFTIAVRGLPQSQWVGNAYAQWKSANMRGYAVQQVGKLVQTLAGAGSAIDSYSDNGDLELTGERRTIVSTAGKLAVQAGSVMRTIGNARTSGTALGGMNALDINTTAALEKYGFQIVYYLCQNYIMSSVDDFFDRYGYKVNRLKKLNRKARPRWTYIKTHEVYIRSDTGLNQPARAYIQTILNQGVTFWMDPEHIGDYSDPAGNKGV